MQRAARITSLVLGIIPILVFLSFTIELLIAKYHHVLPYHGLTWLDVKMAFEGQFLTGVTIGGPLLLATCVAWRWPLIGAVIMLALSGYFIYTPLASYDMANWAAFIGLIYVIPAILYLMIWRKGKRAINY